ncbi:MAG TPA: 3'-5' exonuclease [Rubrivivax sp.]|nr:3'-5' exonuclease [Burkholderiales bacterium]HNT39280.1 3'-5' exonuclease [Rubrivivax sp.]
MTLLRRLLGGGAATDEARWVVLDVEASGLDATRDRLLAVAAIAVRTGRTRAAIALGDSFEVVLHNEPAAADKANILVHGIGVGAQRGGVEPAEALAAFERFAGASPLIAFHAAYDRTLIERGFRSAFGRCLANRWLDLASLAAVLQPQVAARSLDEWMQHFGIVCAARHQAAADALATAELLLRLWPALRRESAAPSFAVAARLAASRHWLGGR